MFSLGKYYRSDQLFKQDTLGMLGGWFAYLVRSQSGALACVWIPIEILGGLKFIRISIFRCIAINPELSNSSQVKARFARNDCAGI